MVEVRYGEHYEIADLLSNSLAEARELYKGRFHIPEKAKAFLNGNQIKKAMESEILLGDEDKVSFEKKKSRKPVLIGAFLLATALTGGAFAYTWTTASATISATADSDFASVAPAGSLPSFSANLFGKYRGVVPSGDLFTVTPDANYTGDLEVKVYLTNVSALTKAYQYLNMELELWDSADPAVNVYAGETGHTYQLLTLDNGVATFDLEFDAGTSPYVVKLSSGGYMTNPRSPIDWNAGYDVAPVLYCEVTQR